MTRRRAIARALTGGLLLAAVAAVPRPALAEQDSPPVRGAVAPEAGQRLYTLGGGLLFTFPYGLASATLGLGGGASATARFESLAVLGWSAAAELAWGTGVESGVAFGVRAFLERASLNPINGLFGVEFQALALGNDWITGGELLTTIDRERGADLTLGLGMSYTLGGPRYLDFDRVENKWDPGVRNVFASVGGEWALTMKARLFIELEVLFPLHTELIPLGYLPTVSSGLTWSLP